MTHTPGPWRVHSEHADRIIVNGCCVYRVGNLAVPDSHEPGVMGEPNPNDVRLMAAAPELLRAMRLIADDLGALDLDSNGWRTWDATAVDSLIAGALRLATLAIAKAEGRSE